MTKTAAELIRPGTPEFRRSSLALFAGGFGTFMLLYSTQTLLPVLAADFGVDPATSSLALSATTGILAVMILAAGGVAERIGYKRVMSASLFAASALTIACVVARDFTILLVFRLATGVALSGLPVCIMAYLGERMAPESVGFAMGLAIGGNALGGLTGRVLTGFTADFLGWRIAMVAVGLIGIVCAALFTLLLLPASPAMRPKSINSAASFHAFSRQFRDPALRLLFALPFLLMGAFVTLYNYIGFHLSRPPYNWSQSEIGALLAVYVVGIASSTAAGRLADRYGRRRMLWLCIAISLAASFLTLLRAEIGIVIGMALTTGGFFAAHSIASSWVARRAASGRAQASSLYLFFYYAGSTIIGSGAGIVFARLGWPGVVGVVTVLHLAGLAIALRLAAIPKLA